MPTSKPRVVALSRACRSDRFCAVQNVSIGFAIVIRLIRSRRPCGAFPVKIEGTSYGKEVRTKESNRQSKAGREGQDQTLTRIIFLVSRTALRGRFAFCEAYDEATVPVTATP